MKQDDALIPYTVNTAITTPTGDDASDPSSLPQQSVDAEVATTLYNVSLTSRPLDFMHVKGRFRYYQYDNDTEQINFDGFVDADDVFVTPDVPGATSIVNLPTSYDKTTAKLDLGFDVWKRTRLTLGYTYEQMDRTNREVDRQEDSIFLGSIDSSPFSWLDLRASYERTDREISGYVFDVYLRSGENLFQLPGLRKYDEADMVRDRFQFFGALYPVDSLVLSGSFIYGEDEFTDSPYGLLEDWHYIITFDVDYTITDRASVYGFYSYEKYQNRQKARGEVPTQPAPVDSDWFSRSQDIVNTAGAGANVALIPNRLHFDVSYSYSDVDGNVDFFTPAVATAEFPIVDETTLQILNAKLKYRAWKGLSFTLGYLWEKFDYDDFNTQGFTNIPVDAAGNYNEAYLMNTLPPDYDANVFYLKATYKF
jgi:MtrB/PioB family decaheme-associated outer membrane protein